MFDSTPAKTSPLPPQSAELDTDTIAQRLDAVRAQPTLFRDETDTGPANPGKVLDLIAVWNGSPGALRDYIEDVADWGPFELAECSPIHYGGDTNRRTLCRFIYHGDSPTGADTPHTRAHFEQCLRASLSQITEWEDAPR